MTPLTLLTAFCVLAGLLAVLWRPQYAVVLILTMFPLEQLLQTYFPYLLRHPQTFNIAALALTTGALVWRFSRGEPVAMGYRNPTTHLIWLLYLLGWFGVLHTPATAPALKIMNEGLPYYFIMLLVLPMLLSDTDSFRRILLGLMVTGSAICVLIYLNPNTSFYAGRLMIDYGPFAVQKHGNPLAVADLGGVISMVAILYRPARAGWLMIVFRIVVVAIGLGLAVASGSRGQVLVAVTAALLFYPLSRGTANAKQFMTMSIGLVCMALAVRFVFSFSINHENEGRWGAAGMSSGVEDRLAMATNLFKWWLSSPVNWPLGLGTNAYTHIDPNNVYVHNIAVEVLCEQGLLGMGLLIAAMWFTFDAGRRLLRLQSQNMEQRAAAATLGALSFYSIVLALKQGTYLDLPTMFMYWFVLAKISRSEQMMLDAQIAEEEEEGAWEALVDSPAARSGMKAGAG